MKELNLLKPLVVFDIEATGLDITNDRIIELSILKITPDNNEIWYNQRFNPEIKISEEAHAVHGISDEDLKDCPLFADEASNVSEFIGDSDLAGYNSNKFDIPMLAEEFLRVNVDIDLKNRYAIDVQNIFHKMEQRTLVAAYKFYCNKNLENAHEAKSDVIATYEVLKAQIKRYEDLSENIEELAKFSANSKNEIIDFAGRIAKNEKGEAVYNFGKHKGKTLKEVNEKEPGYYSWMLNNNFPLYTKKVLKAEFEKIKANTPNKKKQVKESSKDITSKLEALKSKFNQ